MKKIITLVLVMIMFLQVPSYSLDTFSLKIVDFDIEINNVMIEKDKSQYPIFTYKELVYLPLTWQNLKALGLDVKFNSVNVFISNSEELAEGYINGEESKLFPETIIAVLPERNIYINDLILENEKEDYPVLEYKGVIYIPMSESFARELLSIDIEFSDEEGLKINSDSSLEIDDDISKTDLQIRNKQIIKDALNLEMSIIARFKDTEATYTLDNAKVYLLVIDEFTTIGLFQYNDGDSYVEYEGV